MVWGGSEGEGIVAAGDGVWVEPCASASSIVLELSIKLDKIGNKIADNVMIMSFCNLGADISVMKASCIIVFIGSE
jgi:hypothetical protein